MAKKPKEKRVYSVEAGRTICLNGKPIFQIQKCGDTGPTEADALTHEVVKALQLLELLYDS